MTDHQHFVPIHEIITLEIEKTLQERNPQGIRTPDPEIAFGPQIFRYSKQDIF